MKHLFTMLLTLVAATASAQDFEVDDICYNILSEDDRTVEVTESPYGYMDNVVIPAEVTYDGSTYSVTTIGVGAFSFCSALTSVEMPAVTTIGDDAFSFCSALTSVDIPASCTSIAGNPFQGCQFLEEIVVDENNPNYSSMDGVLYDKDKTTLIGWPTAEGEIDIMPSVTTIGDWAFFWCGNLTSVSMPAVTTIGNSAFYYCGKLTSVSMPSVTTIGKWAFSDCSALTSVSMPAVTTIGEYAFSDCSALTSVSMPAVTTIGGSAFSDCSALTSVSMLVATTIGRFAFSDCSALTSVSMPSVTTIGRYAFEICSALTSVSMPSVTTIGDYAFNDCSALTSVDIPASCTSIGSFLFAGCTALKEIVVDDNNPNYSSADGVLYDKGKTTLLSWPTAEGGINLPLSVTKIGVGAFISCYSLTSVSMPSVTTIGNWAFSDCSALTSVSMPAVTTIGDEAFGECSALTSVEMPAVTTIGEYAFGGCSALTSVDIPASVTMIGEGAFTYCDALTAVYCHWDEPLECEPFFTDEVIANATLYVPTGTVDAYRSTFPWSEFANIEERDYSGIAGTPQSEVTVKVIDGVITVEGGDGMASAPVVEVYSAGGQCVWRGTDSSIGGLTHGIYVVKVGDTVQKVAL